MIDPEFREAWDRNVALHYKLGTALVEQVDQAGLLLTAQRRDQVEYLALRALQDKLGARVAVTMMQLAHRRAQGTPDEMFRAISEWMGDYIRGNRTHM